MANPLYQEMHQKINAQDALRQLKQNPYQLIKQAGYNIPANIANNPQAVVMHILQSGQVSNPMLNMLSRMIGRK